MKEWKDKYIIGLTGNIATGKSALRKMLEHLGAYGIDADALGHRALWPDSPAFPRVVEAFGEDILDENGRIARPKLGRIVFADVQALRKLERIVHPLIYGGIDRLVSRAPQAVIVLEAYILLDGELADRCDEIWVTHTLPEIQMERLMQTRRLSEADARLRISAQPPQEAKIAAADVVIENDGALEGLWNQTAQAWDERIAPALKARGLADPRRSRCTRRGEMTVCLANPDQAREIALFIETTGGGHHDAEGQDVLAYVLAQFSRKTFITLRNNDKMIGLAGWTAENWLACVDEVLIPAGVASREALDALLDEAENASRAFQCEAILVHCPPQVALRRYGWEERGFLTGDIENDRHHAWLEAARKSASKDTVVFYKQLSQGQVLRG